nr:MAG TPA: hypothetical protein [Caudoviricetes sp.]
MAMAGKQGAISSNRGWQGSSPRIPREILK